MKPKGFLEWKIGGTLKAFRGGGRLRIGGVKRGSWGERPLTPRLRTSSGTGQAALATWDGLVAKGLGWVGLGGAERWEEGRCKPGDGHYG